jgi:hypothetical protein
MASIAHADARESAGMRFATAHDVIAGKKIPANDSPTKYTSAIVLGVDSAAIALYTLSTVAACNQLSFTSRDKRVYSIA